jgi:5-methylcytosine-specific restriction protein A
MQTFSFTTKPTEYPEQVRRKNVLWCCSRRIRSGDCIWVYVTGKGLCYEWRAISDSHPDPTRRYSYVCEVEFVCDFEPPITRQQICAVVTKKEWNKPHINMKGRAASIIEDCAAKKIRALLPANSLQELEQKFLDGVAASKRLSEDERLKLLALAPKYPIKDKVTTGRFRRNEHVVAQVLFRAAGYCEDCKHPAPFNRAADGEPYLEVHHKIWLARGGEDTVENAMALCPNCHRKAHHG